MIRQRPALLLFILGTSLAGCAVAPPAPAPVDGSAEQAWRARAARLNTIEAFRIKTKLGVSAPERTGQGTMVWQRAGFEHHIDVFGPLGGGRVVLTRDASGALLRDGEHTYAAETMEQALWEATGWQIPFTAMSYWVLGLPAPDRPYGHELDAHGRLRTLEQSGWRIRYDDYRPAGQYDLPRKMVLESAQYGPGTDAA
ncbi:MAG: lipoprotein insertase outer membrane protein LolB, partial [Gammaproteobacteria bacterium]|nr:lipoprotein insertase outer membrane protein LolB [Gammaproteobacteria bacterium]